MTSIIIIMTMPCYESGKTIMTAACYKGGKLMITSLIIIMKIRFVYFQENEADGSYVRLHAGSHSKSYNYRSCDHGVIRILFKNPLKRQYLYHIIQK